MAFGTQDETDDVMNEINMTPLVDIMLVLLIIFIITVPVMKHSVNIDLPRASSQPQDAKPQTVRVTVDAQGIYYWNEGRIDDSERESLATSHETRDALDALIAGKEPPVTSTRVFGCSVKWADKVAEYAKFKERWAAEPVTLEKADAAKLREIRANAGTGKLRFINVWATWCGPCIAEFDELIEQIDIVVEPHEAKPVRVLQPIARKATDRCPGRRRFPARPRAADGGRQEHPVRTCRVRFPSRARPQRAPFPAPDSVTPTRRAPRPRTRHPPRGSTGGRHRRARRSSSDVWPP